MEKYTKIELINVVKKSNTYRQVLLSFNRNTSSASYRVLKKHLKKWNIDISHFLSPKEVLMLNFKEGKIKKLNDNKIFCLNSKVGRSTLKLRFKTLVEFKCSLCGQDEIWNGMKISLILDHINGINNDNRKENLRFLCPNCNAGIPTHCNGRVGVLKSIEKQIIMDNKIDKRNKYNGVAKIKQRKVERPSYIKLIAEIDKFGYCGTGKKYNVSDNAIRKWKKFYEKQQLLIK